MKYTVHYTRPYSEGVTVEADSPAAAIKEAEQSGIGGLCHQCCGGGIGSNWFRDDGAEAEITEVQDATGETVWDATKDEYPED